MEQTDLMRGAIEVVTFVAIVVVGYIFSVALLLLG
jgi:hypothetical protein